MRKTQKIIALALGSVMSLAMFAGCRGDEGDPYVASALSARICYDNLNAGYVEEEDTQYTLELKKEVSDIVVTAKDADGKDVSDPSSVAVFDEATGVLTAKGTGTVTLSLQDGSGKELSSVKVEVAPAYTVDPENQYNLSSSEDYGTQSSNYAGWCHDPSLIEVEEDGLLYTALSRVVAEAPYFFRGGALWEERYGIERYVSALPPGCTFEEAPACE